MKDREPQQGKIETSTRTVGNRAKSIVESRRKLPPSKEYIAGLFFVITSSLALSDADWLPDMLTSNTQVLKDNFPIYRYYLGASIIFHFSIASEGALRIFQERVQNQQH